MSINMTMLALGTAEILREVGLNEGVLLTVLN